MNLLPKSREEFSQKEYWDSFFKKRGNQAFEWYGEYPELCEHLHKYIKVKDDVLIVGCGNSTLGNDLYDIGYNKIINIDISQVAIRQMINLNSKKRPDMQFIHMDALDMKFENEQFSAIIDKGTLDALMPDGEKETVERIQKYFDEIMRVLKVSGRYVCVSLLQEHILKMIVDYFPAKNCMLRIIRCFEAEKSAAEAGENPMPVFLIVCTKFKVLPMKILELNLAGSEKMVRIPTEDELMKNVQSVQQAAYICTGLKRTTIDDDVHFDLYKSGENSPRYTVYVVDGPSDKKKTQYAGFIVPQGRESEWMFSSTEGRKYLVDQSNCNRLAIITMHRGQTYENLDVVKSELGDCVRSMAPSTFGSKTIMFLSLGPTVGERNVVYEGESEFSGKYVIEDVEADNKRARRLYYLNSQNVIQSEANIKQIKSRKGTVKDVIDVNYLTCEHHIYMSRAVHMITKKDKPADVAIIGLGGGGLCGFLRKFLPRINITAVDIDPEMLEVATKYFGLNVDDQMKIDITDGLQFLSTNATKGIKYDAVLFDVDNKDTGMGMSCPPKDFLSEQTLANVVNNLKPKGLFILNVVLRNTSLRPNLLEGLSSKFETIAFYKLETDLNEIFICSRDKVSKNSFETRFSAATKKLNEYFSGCGHKSLVDDDDPKILNFYDASQE